MSEIQDSAKHLVEVLHAKNEGYTGGLGEFYNFEKAAKFANVSPSTVMFSQLAIKWTRLEGLLQDDRTAGSLEIQDTLLDLAGYAIILRAYGRWAESRNKETYSAPATPSWDPAG